MRLRLLVAPFLVVGLAACTATPVPHEVPVRELTVPASLHRTHAAVSYSTALPAAADRPALPVGRSSEPGGPDRPTVWWSTNGAAWTQRPLGTPVAGELVDLVAGGDVLEAYVAGTTRSEGRSTPWLLRHAGGGDWEDVPLPDGVPANAALLGVAVTGGEAVLVVADTDRGWHAVRTGRDPSVTRLPDVADDVRRDLVSVAAADDRLVVLAEEGPRRAAVPVVAYRSPDRGSSWSEPVPAFPPGTGITGTATDGPTFLATGWTRADPAAPKRPAAWRSIDGVTWTNEPVVIPERLQERLARTDVTLTSPARATALMTLGDVPYLMAMRRDPATAWTELGPTGRTHTPSPGGVLTTVTDRVVVGVTGRDAGEIGSLPLYGASDWVEHATNGEPVDSPVAYRTDDGADGLVLTTHTREQVVTPETWSVGSRTEQLALDTGGVGAPLSRPAQAPDASTPMTAHGRDDASVLLAPDDFRDDGRLTWAGWFTPAGGGAQAFTLPTAGADWVASARSAGQGWVAIGSTRPEATFAAESAPAGWTSPDGVTWAREALPLPEGVSDADVDALCRWDDGSAAAVGGGTASSDVPHPLAWVVDGGGRWEPLSADVFGDGASLDDCADGDSTIAVLGSVGGRDTIWELDRDGGAAAVRQADDGDRLDDVARTAAGLAVVGTAREDDWVGGVLDVQVEGKWVRTRIPVGHSSTAVVAVVDDVVQTYWQTPTGVAGFGVDLADLRTGDG